MKLLAALLAALVLAPAAALAGPRDAEIPDADTLAWWRIAERLSSDRAQGRDVASNGYINAAKAVAQMFHRQGLKPAGELGTYFQTVPLREVRVEKAGTAFAVVRDGGGETHLRFLYDITVRPADGLPPALEAPLTFRGYCAPTDLTDVNGKAVICFNTRRTGMTTSAQRVNAARAAGAAAIVQVDDPYFTIEPPRWPAAYARTVVPAGTPAGVTGIVILTLAAEALPALIVGSGQDAAALLEKGGRKQPVASFEVPSRLRIRLAMGHAEYNSFNVLAVLPGTDPVLKAEHVVVSAHLDGYGYGEPVDGDDLYNGTLDDAAYVGSLVRLAANRKGKPGLKRSILFVAFAGEEKGLQGSYAFVRRPTIPHQNLAAVINLDQLRPLFPLKILTALAVDDTSLGTPVREVAARHGVEIRPDPEPERGLLQRSDHWPFMQVGVPAVGFIFGYDEGSEAERRYREWYQVRYHRPQDDLTQPIDFQAAGDFNRFFYDLTAVVADLPARPEWKPDSLYAPKP